MMGAIALNSVAAIDFKGMINQVQRQKQNRVEATNAVVAGTGAEVTPVVEKQVEIVLT